MCPKILIAREKEESIARQQSPITQEIYSALLNQANKSPVDSVETVVTNWFTLIQFTGLHCTEYAHKNQTSYDEHKYPSGKHVVKAFIPSGWKNSNGKGRLLGPMEITKKVEMTFRIQMNRQNGQSITLMANDAHPEICPIQAAHCILLRAKKLDQLDSEPMGVFVNKFSIKNINLTGKKSPRYYNPL
jgi:hypothetical protein